MGYNINPAFADDDNKLSTTNATIELGNKSSPTSIPNGTANEANEEPSATITSKTNASNDNERGGWGNDIEFLMSCIAMSVGLGNVWRFPFTALENGGGAFLIPYLIVLVIIGRPLYYLEMLLGQFSGRSSLKVFDLAPAMRGVGYGQVISTGIVGTYYVSIMAVTLHFFFNSFKSVLPWTERLPGWDEGLMNQTSTAQLYYEKVVLKEYVTIHNGIGAPDLHLALCLALAWIIIVSVLIKGVQSSGKASYFLALFPYVVLLILLVRAVTLPGAWNGILFFLRPQWEKLFEAKVWYNAITQCFFSLAVCFGNLIMYASFNRFEHNVYRDATIVTTLDTFTSMLAGFCIFGILGHLAHEVGIEDIDGVGKVIKGGAGLAFISYPDAIARFQLFPQAFSVLFFFMLFVLGIGSNIAMCSCIITAIKDQFPKWKNVYVVLGVALVGYSVGLAYVTPGGQFILTLVDFFGASYIVFVLAIAEIVAFCWIYGVDRICRDVEFMIGRNPGIYWRICWGILTPVVMTVILIYTFITYEPLTYKKTYVYPPTAYAIGWTISAMGIIQLPLWAVYAVIKQKGNTLSEKLQYAFQPNAKWGPTDPIKFEKYQKYIMNWQNEIAAQSNQSFLQKCKQKVFG